MAELGRMLEVNAPQDRVGSERMSNDGYPTPKGTFLIGEEILWHLWRHRQRDRGSRSFPPSGFFTSLRMKECGG